MLKASTRERAAIVMSVLIIAASCVFWGAQIFEVIATLELAYGEDL